MKKLIVHYAPDCPFSAATIAFLTLRGADFESKNLDEHPEDKARLEARAKKKLETPTLEALGKEGPEVHVAPPLSQLKELLLKWGLGAEVAPYEQVRAH